MKLIVLVLMTAMFVSAVFASPGDIIRSQSISGQPSSGIRGLAMDWDTNRIWVAGPNGTDNIIFTSDAGATYFFDANGVEQALVTRFEYDATGRLTRTWLPDGSAGRTLGLDADTRYSSARGGLFPRGASVGHTGFTGTSLWLDPQTGGYVVLLASRLHPDGEGSVGELRSAVATAAATSVRPRA